MQRSTHVSQDTFPQTKAPAGVGGAAKLPLLPVPRPWGREESVWLPGGKIPGP